MQDDCSKSVLEFFRVGGLESVAADDRSLTRAVTQAENSPDGIFFFGFPDLSSRVLICGKNILMCESDDLGDRVVGFFCEISNDRVARVPFAFGEVKKRMGHVDVREEYDRTMEKGDGFLPDELQLGGITRTDGLNGDGMDSRRILGGTAVQQED